MVYGFPHLDTLILRKNQAFLFGSAKTKHSYSDLGAGTVLFQTKREVLGKLLLT